MNNEKFEKGSLESFLLNFSPECRADDDERTDEQVTQGMVKRNHPLSIQKAIEQGREVLAMEPFPWEWITDLVGSYWDKDTQRLIEDPQFYHRWLKKVIDTLEEEAKRQGKL